MRTNFATKGELDDIAGSSWALFRSIASYELWPLTKRTS